MYGEPRRQAPARLPETIAGLAAAQPEEPSTDVVSLREQLAPAREAARILPRHAPGRSCTKGSCPRGDRLHSPGIPLTVHADVSLQLDAWYLKSVGMDGYPP